MSATIELQRRANLQRGIEVRQHRASLKTALTAGDISLSEALSTSEDWAQNMRVSILLLAVPRIGPTKLRRALLANNIRPSLTLEHFPKWRQDQLLAWLQTNCPSVRVYGKGAKLDG